jgi:hypothetical protein
MECAAQLDPDQNLFLHVKAKPAIFGGDGQTEQTQFAHLSDDLVRHSVILGDLRFDGAQTLGDEATDGFDQLRAGFKI